ncbi:hypothetical protein Rsub_08292 [Raphidocelis subcapitata]|uniref:Uncharacterized protein n=1 Tax=Raphidocelis subcapitata TaxID=307507 RepID=A0A2V0P5W6_9CHLO|nr:hypothetical protein Rsub_08292 [Raphidocelis subcapitata]|eukprot:GBF95261.1 hypothetical protein Rsub_08292 [Raphidocelis subcapitata]
MAPRRVFTLALMLALAVSGSAPGAGARRLQGNSTGSGDPTAGFDRKPAKGVGPSQGINLGNEADAIQSTPNKTPVPGAISKKSNNISDAHIHLEFDPKEIAGLLKAFLRGTVSNNTAEATTPDDGYSSTMSGAINLNPFLDGTALANSLALSGRNATSDSKGMVFGIAGTGKVTSQATALGKTSASSDVQGLSLNGIGAQHTVSSNLAFTAGSAATAVKSGAMTLVGPVVASGLSNALGVKSATADGKAASATGLGPSSSSIFANAFTAGTSSASGGVLATAIRGPTHATTGSLATSLLSDASTDSKSKSLSGQGSSVSKSGATAFGKTSAESSADSNSTSVKGAADAASSSLALGIRSASSTTAESNSGLGPSQAVAASSASGVTSAAASANATAHAKAGRQSSRSSSSSSSGLARKGLFGFAFLPVLPPFPQLPSLSMLRGKSAEPSAVRIVSSSLAQGAGLKALLPAVPKITPGFASDAAPIEAAVAPGNISDAAPACNNASGGNNCTAPTNSTAGNSTINPLEAMGGLFSGLVAKNKEFMAKNMPPPPPNATLPARAPAPPAPKTRRVVLPTKPASAAPTPLSEAIRSASLSDLPPLPSGSSSIPKPAVRKPVAASGRRLRR